MVKMKSCRKIRNVHAVSVGGDMQADKNGSVLSEDKM